MFFDVLGFSKALHVLGLSDWNVITLELYYFAPWVYPTGSIVIAFVGPSVRLSIFEYLRERSLVFSEILYEVWDKKVKQSDTARISKS